MAIEKSHYTDVSDVIGPLSKYILHNIDLVQKLRKLISVIFVGISVFKVAFFPMDVFSFEKAVCFPFFFLH